jgi:hypothetical protein
VKAADSKNLPIGTVVGVQNELEPGGEFPHLARSQVRKLRTWTRFSRRNWQRKAI